MYYVRQPLLLVRWERGGCVEFLILRAPAPSSLKSSQILPARPLIASTPFGLFPCREFGHRAHVPSNLEQWHVREKAFLITLTPHGTVSCLWKGHYSSRFFHALEPVQHLREKTPPNI